MAVNNEDIRILEQKQRELKYELERKSAQIDAERQRIVEENRKQLLNLQRETAQMLKERDEVVLQNYNSILDNNISKASEMLQNEFNEYRMKYDEVCLQVSAAYAEEQRKTEDILIKQKNFEKIYFNRLEHARNNAIKIMNDVIEKVNSVTEKEPIEWFMNGHLELYRSRLREMQKLIEMQLYESAIGIGNNVMLYLEMDIIETKERFYKWFNHYMVLNSVLESERILIFDEAHIVPAEFKNFIKAEKIIENSMSDDIIDKWSEYRFSALKESYHKFSEEIENFRINGIAVSDENSLRQYMIEHPEKSVQFREMWLYSQGVKALEKLNNAKKIINEMFDKIHCFDERIDIAKRIRKCLKKSQYVYEVKDTSAPSDDSLYISFTDSYGFNIEVIIVPVFRKSDNKWKNFIKFYFGENIGRERHDNAIICISEALLSFGITIRSEDKIRTGQTKEERIKNAGVDIRLLVNGRLD